MRCTRISEGCRECWHLKTADRLCKNPGLPNLERSALSGEGGFVLRNKELSAPTKTKKPAVIGVQFMGDLFHEDVSVSARDFIYHAMNCAPWHKYLLLTKRPDAMLADIKRAGGGTLPDYIWPGLTVVNQQEADEKQSGFMKVPGKKFLSLEPLLSDIPFLLLHDISLVIIGCETGPHRRPCKLEWIRSIVEQCRAAGVPVWVKQIEIERDIHPKPNNRGDITWDVVERVSHDMAEFPPDLRVRELAWKVTK
jgi:protein gp37